jgi:hypothetical protein
MLFEFGFKRGLQERKYRIKKRCQGRSRREKISYPGGRRQQSELAGANTTHEVLRTATPY